MKPNERRPFWMLAALFSLTYLAFVPCLQGQFVVDDWSDVAYNPVLRMPWLWPRLFYDKLAIRPDEEMAALVYRPLNALSYALNGRLGGFAPFWFHLFDVVLHGVNACLVFLLARRFLKSLPAAAGAALLFAWHPVQVESVAAIGSRPGLLPVANVVPITALAADRFLYAPLVGLTLLWGLLLDRLAPRRAWLAAAALCLFLLPVTLERELAWRGEFVLDLEARAQAPEDACAALDLWVHYYRWGMSARALTLAQEGLKPGVCRVYRQLAREYAALALLRLGKNAEAVPYLEAALADEPGNSRLLRHLAAARRPVL